MTKRPIEKVSAARMVFLAEQMGSTEDDLKGALASAFSLHPDIDRAYLVRVTYGDDATQMSVALCIAAPEKHELVEAAASVFRTRFASSAALDIAFVSGAREEELRRVAKPFYVRATA
jgi:hypothetical protein